MKNCHVIRTHKIHPIWFVLFFYPCFFRIFSRYMERSDTRYLNFSHLTYFWFWLVRARYFKTLQLFLHCQLLYGFGKSIVITSFQAYIIKNLQNCQLLFPLYPILMNRYILKPFYIHAMNAVYHTFTWHQNCYYIDLVKK